MKRLSIDFKGPLVSETENQYILTALEEDSRFPLAFPILDKILNSLVIALDQVISLCGYPVFIHSDTGADFLSEEV